MTDEQYLGTNETWVDEGYIASYPYSTYGKLGFTADGISRLILRVQINKPGYASFTVDDIGATLERLKDRRGKNNSAISIRTSQEGELGYQASAVLIAPERFPAKKKFPNDTFKVHVKFMTYNGTTAKKV